MPINSISVKLPGDVIDKEQLGIKGKKPLTGPGLSEHDGDIIQACKAGCLKLRTEGGCTLWIDNQQKRVLIT